MSLSLLTFFILKLRLPGDLKGLEDFLVIFSFSISVSSNEKTFDSTAPGDKLFLAIFRNEKDPDLLRDPDLLGDDLVLSNAVGLSPIGIKPGLARFFRDWHIS